MPAQFQRLRIDRRKVIADDLGDHDRNVVRSATQIGQVDEQMNGLLRGQVPRMVPNSSSLTRPVSPSLQSRKVSSRARGSGPSISGCTVEFGPSRGA